MRKAVAAGRTGLAGIGFVGIAAITVACSSSTSGSAVSSGNGGGGGGGGNPLAGSGSASAPQVPGTSGAPSLPTDGSVPSLTGSKFCEDLTKVGNLGQSLSGNPDKTKLDKLGDAIDALTLEAPGEIKGDLNVISTYIHDAAKGKIDTNLATKLAKAGGHIQTYITQNCHTS